MVARGASIGWPVGVVAFLGGALGCAPTTRDYGSDGNGGGPTSSAGHTSSSQASTGNGGGGASASSSSGAPGCMSNADCPSGPNSAATCNDGHCDFVCTTGFADCDQDRTTGCEIDLTQDLGNCGTCGKACFYTCQAGTCSDPVEISVGATHTCAVLGTGAVSCWGDNSSGQLGNGTTGGTFPKPTQVTLPGPATRISAGGSPSSTASHTCALLASGQVYCWGSNTSLQLANGSTMDTPTPKPVVGLPAGVTAVSAGSTHTCAIAGTQLSCWGNNTVGQIGNGIMGGTQSTPASVLGNVAQVEAGWQYTCAVDTAGKAFCWGLNTDGRLGVGDTANRMAPTGISLAGPVLGITAFSLHTCAWTAADVFCWGDNTNKQLGAPSAPSGTVPVPTALGFGTVQAVSAGLDFTGALQGNGDLEMWGLGPLANGATSAPVPTPVNLSGVTRFGTGGRSITGVSKHACALKKTGEMVCWGSDMMGQLGDGVTGGTQPMPVTVKF
jgi:alpha-tubulin suppressor-like RCC1 family protein